MSHYTLRLYSYWRSSASWRVRIALALKNVPFEYVPVNISAAVNEQKAEGYASLNPLQQVPTLSLERDGMLSHVAQSVAIIELLEELFPSPALLPAEPIERALVRQVVEMINSGTQPLQNLEVLNKLEQLAGSAAAESWAKVQIAKGLTAVERVVSQHAGRFCFGNELTLADIFLVPQVYNARRHGADISGCPTILAIEQHCSGLAAFQNSHPTAQLDCPTVERSLDARAAQQEQQ